MENSDLKLVEVSWSNVNIFKNLAQAYEAEFSKLTQKMPDKYGMFTIDTEPFPPHIGYILYFRDIPVGFCVADVKSKIKDIAEFYIVPVMRRKKLGYQFGVEIANKYPGQWQARQIEGATDASNFCRSAIRKYTGGQYEEAIVFDAKWGSVTRQRLKTNEELKKLN